MIDFYADFLQRDKDFLEELTANMRTAYKTFSIPKANGKRRWLDEPCEDLKQIQNELLNRFFYKFKAHSAAVGFIKGMGITEGVNRHFGNRVILTMDLTDFFGTIKKERVLKLLIYLIGNYQRIVKDIVEYEIKDLQLLTRLLTFKDKLPQGAPTSPAIANLTAYGLDKDLIQIAQEHSLIYTRYADDITFSHKDKDHNIGQHISSIENTCKTRGFTVNKKKTRIRRPHQRMLITGVVVNDKLSVPRWRWRNFKAKLHNLVQNKTGVSAEELQTLRGYAEWLRVLNPTKGVFFIQQLDIINTF